MCIVTRVCYISMIGKVPSQCVVGLMSYIKHMTLELSMLLFIVSIRYLILIPVALQAVSQITALACVMQHDITSFIAV